MYLCRANKAKAKIYTMTTIETLRAENKELLSLTTKLLKKFNKIVKTNQNGAKLIFARVEETELKRQSNNEIIISLL